MTTAALMSSTMTTTTTAFFPTVSSNEQQQNCHQEIIECPTTVQFDPTTLTLVTDPPRSTTSNSFPVDSTSPLPNLANVTFSSDITPASTVPGNIMNNTITSVDIAVTTNAINNTTTVPAEIVVTANAENVVAIPAENTTEIPTTADSVETINATEINDSYNYTFENLQDNINLANWSIDSPLEGENLTETTYHDVGSLNITASVVYYDTSSESLDDVDDKWNYDTINDSTTSQSSTIEFESTEIPVTELTVSSTNEFDDDFISTQSMKNSITESIPTTKNESVFLPHRQADETLSSSKLRIKRMQENDTHCYRYVCSKQSTGSIVTDMPRNTQEFTEKSSNYLILLTIYIKLD